MKIIKTKNEKGFTTLVFEDSSESEKILSSLVFKLKIKNGDEISPEELNGIYLKSETVRAKKKAVYYLSRSSLNSGLLKEKLLKHFSENIADIAVSFCTEHNFLNDEDYAKRLINTLILQNKSKNEIKQKLYYKKVDKLLAEDLLNSYEFNDYSAAENILYKKYGKKAVEDKNKAITALMRKGFSYDTAKTVTEKYLNELESIN